MRNSEFKIQDYENSRNLIGRIKSREDMTDKEFNDFMELSMEQAENGELVSVEGDFEEVFKELLNN